MHYARREIAFWQLTKISSKLCYYYEMMFSCQLYLCFVFSRTSLHYHDCFLFEVCPISKHVLTGSVSNKLICLACVCIALFFFTTPRVLNDGLYSPHFGVHRTLISISRVPTPWQKKNSRTSPGYFPGHFWHFQGFHEEIWPTI